MPSSHLQVFVDILRRHAVIRSKHPAVTFLGVGGSEETWSYADLDARARAMAVRLLELTEPGERALLLCPQGLDFVAAMLGCFYSGVVAVPAYPPANARHLPRIARIMADSQASVVISTAGARTRIQPWLDGVRDQDREVGDLLLCEDVDPAGADRFVGRDLPSGDHALLQYTSGSTASPRGVVVTHHNLVANLAMLQHSFQLTDRSDSVSWLPLFHDMGLIGGLLEPLYLGAHTVLLAPATFIRRPVTWLEAITRFRPDWVGAPNFGYARCVEGISAEQRRSLDLSSLRLAYCGSEPIDHRVASLFFDIFAPCGLHRKAFQPCYGLAEATLFVAGSEPGSGGRRLHLDGAELERHRARRINPATPSAKVLFSCGKPAQGTRLRIVDPDSCMALPDGQVGEIWVAGAHIAAGYWRNTEQTRAVLGAQLADGSDNDTYLRTGDLGFLDAGEVCVTGRINDVLIIRGRNHYPQDLEHTVAAAHPDLQPADGGAAFSIDGGEQPVVAHEVRRTALRQLDGRAIVSAIRQAVTEEHELSLQAVVLLQPATLPRTSSGKAQRRECARAFRSGELVEVFRWEAPLPTADVPPALEPSGHRGPNSRELPDNPGSAERAGRVIAWLRDYAESRIDSRLIDERRTISPHVVLDLGRMGVLGLRAPAEIGGLALSHHDMLRVLQQLAAIDTTLASFVGVHNALGLQPLLLHGTPAQRHVMLPDLAQGRQLASFAFTEPAAGSNPTAIGSTAIENDDGTYSLRGSKRWIGTAAWSGYVHVFAHVIDRAGVNRGITAFTLPQGSAGLVQGPEELTVGMRGMVQNTVELCDVRVDADGMLGSVGQGMQIAQGIMEFGRLCIASVALGVLKRSAQLMVRYAGRRQIASGRLMDNVVSRDRLTALLVETVALEGFVKSFAGWLDAGVDVPGEIYAALKALSAETAYRGVDSLVQMLGGRGYIETNLVPQMMRDVRLLRVFEGPSETMLMFVGSRVATGSEPLRRFLRDELHAGEMIGAIDNAVRDLAQAGIDVQRRAALLGELGGWAVWRAVLDARAGAGEKSLAARARGWIAERFASAMEAIASAVAGSTPEPLAAGEIEAAVAGFARDIGDHEQRHPGAVEQLDPLLQRDGAAAGGWAATAPPLQRRTSVPSIGALGPIRTPSRVPALPAAAGVGAVDRAAIEDWLQQWTAARSRQDVASIDRRRAFADFGLDSITVVELADQLSQFAGVEVPSTSPWDYPTIEALAAAVAESLTLRRVDHRPVDDRNTPDRPALADVDLGRMSDQELARLLSREVDDMGDERS
jgi:acyl-CoA synthetase (AMP-forming)/AMP-acid ligase II/alkylation response protein AidB-like acyl-CoA dehydrogenase/acyl carrier protein